MKTKMRLKIEGEAKLKDGGETKFKMKKRYRKNLAKRIAGFSIMT